MYSKIETLTCLWSTVYNSHITSCYILSISRTPAVYMKTVFVECMHDDDDDEDDVDDDDDELRCT